MAMFKERIQKDLAEIDIQIGGTRPWDIQVHAERLYRQVILRGSIGLGEAYMDGWWDCAQLDEFFNRILRAQLHVKHKAIGQDAFHILSNILFNKQSPARSFVVGERHYDIGNDLYKAMLDKRMVYTCGYWGGNPPAGGDLTDQDKQTIAQLVQQAVAEARTATQLNPNKSAAWANLANIYRQLINFAQDADQFSIAAYTRAVQLDPANPQLRLEFGSLFYSLKRYDEAVARFQEAAQLKTDFANAYYNLSHAYQDQEKFLEAYQVMQSVISLVPADSADAAKVQEELTNLQTKLPKTTAAETTTPVTEPAAQLTEPSPPPAAPKDFEPVNLEASPSPKP